MGEKREGKQESEAALVADFRQGSAGSRVLRSAKRFRSSREPGSGTTGGAHPA